VRAFTETFNDCDQKQLKPTPEFEALLEKDVIAENELAVFKPSAPNSVLHTVLQQRGFKASHGGKGTTWEWRREKVVFSGGQNLWDKAWGSILGGNKAGKTEFAKKALEAHKEIQAKRIYFELRTEKFADDSFRSVINREKFASDFEKACFGQHCFEIGLSAWIVKHHKVDGKVIGTLLSHLGFDVCYYGEHASLTQILRATRSVDWAERIKGKHPGHMVFSILPDPIELISGKQMAKLAWVGKANTTAGALVSYNEEGQIIECPAGVQPIGVGIGPNEIFGELQPYQKALLDKFDKLQAKAGKKLLKAASGSACPTTQAPVVKRTVPPSQLKRKLAL
jgi:hypothetical protein